MRDKHDSERLPKRYYEALGRMLVAFQALEGEVTYALIKLTDPQKNSEVEAQFLFALESMPFKSKIKLLRNFAATKPIKYYLWPGCPMEEKRKEELPGILGEMKTYLLEAAKLEDERNALVHSDWMPFLDGRVKGVRRHKVKVRDNGIRFVVEPVSHEHLLEVVERMQTARQAISGISTFLSWLVAEKRSNTSVEPEDVAHVKR